MNGASGCRPRRRLCIRGLPGTAYPFAGLSGAGVAFKVAWAVCQRASDAKKVSPPMREFLLEGGRAGGDRHRGRRRAAGG